MSSPKEVLLSTVVPILGGIVAIVMYTSPLKATYEARKKQQLGDLNPVPFAVTFASTACWNAYGFAAPDYNMFLPNIPGFAAATFTTVTCYALASLQVQNMLLSILCGSSVIILLLGVMTRFVMETQQARLMWGIVCNIITVIYYSAPVSSAIKVVRTRNSASIYRPTCIANLANAALWVAYGVAVGDPFIWVPNGIGGIMSVFLITLTIIYPATAAPANSMAGLSAPLNAPVKPHSDGGSSIALLVDAGSSIHQPNLHAAAYGAYAVGSGAAGSTNTSVDGAGSHEAVGIQHLNLEAAGDDGKAGAAGQPLLRERRSLH